MIRILGRTNSIAVQKVLWTAGEIGIDFHQEDAGGSFGFTKEYERLNPNKKVPTIVDKDGFVLYESHAICKYLVSKYGKESLYPCDVKKRALIDQYLDWQLTAAYPPLQLLFMTVIRGAKRTDEEIAKAKDVIAEKWGIFEQTLSDGRPHLSGEEFTIGDIPMAISMYRWINITNADERPSLPYTKNWYERVSARQHFKTRISNFPLT